MYLWEAELIYSSPTLLIFKAILILFYNLGMFLYQFSNILSEIEFQSIESAKEYAKASQDKIFGYPRHDYACVDDQYPYDIECNFREYR